jgi:small subunit ribosomal protein S16
LVPYNPNTNPATIELTDSAVKWLHNGAQPTDTAKAYSFLTKALLKHHLDGGIRKGALTQEQAEVTTKRTKTPRDKFSCHCKLN